MTRGPYKKNKVYLCVQFWRIKGMMTVERQLMSARAILWTSVSTRYVQKTYCKDYLILRETRTHILDNNQEIE